MGTSAHKYPVGEARERIKKLYVAGISARTIGIELGISTSAVYQHIAALREAGELPEPQEAVS
jgi:transposase